VALILDSVMKFRRPELLVRYPSSPKSAWLCGHTNNHSDCDDREEHVSSYAVHMDDRQPDDNNPVILAALAREWDVVRTLLAHFNTDPNAVSDKASDNSLFKMETYAQEWTVCQFDLFPLVLHLNQREFSARDCHLLQWVVGREQWELASSMVGMGYVCVRGRHDM